MLRNGVARLVSQPRRCSARTFRAETIVYDPDTDTAIRFGLGDAPVWRTIAGEMSSLPDATIHVVPEPATLSLLAVGACLLARGRQGFAFVGRRRT